MEMLSLRRGIAARLRWPEKKKPGSEGFAAGLFRGRENLSRLLLLLILLLC
jgi:hypothetical protein